MPINKNIQREHIFQAIIELNKNQFSVTKWVLNYDNNFYPVLEIIRKSNLYATGEIIMPDPNDIQSQMAVRYLIDLGFEILNYDTGEIFNLQNPY
jgi:hypothetical protein